MTALTFATALEQFNAEFAPVRIPPIADFARERIEREIGWLELDRDEFFARVDALAVEVPCPKYSQLTYAGEHLNDYVLAQCNAPEFTDAQTNAYAADLMAQCPEFRYGFAEFYRKGILAQMDEERAERGRLANRQEDGEWMP